MDLLNFKQEIIKEIKKEGSMWRCKLCNKDLPTGNYCVENHFSKVHPNVNCSRLTDEDGANWRLVDIDERRAIKCINRVYRRIKRAKK